MGAVGFEPTQALSQRVYSPSPLATRAHAHGIEKGSARFVRVKPAGCLPAGLAEVRQHQRQIGQVDIAVPIHISVGVADATRSEM
jgi:hypothetical protein